MSKLTDAYHWDTDRRRDTPTAPIEMIPVYPGYGEIQRLRWDHKTGERERSTAWVPLGGLYIAKP